MIFISEGYSFQTRFLEEKQLRALKEAQDFRDNLTPLFKDRLTFKPIIPEIIKNLDDVQIADGPKTEAPADQAELKKLFKNTYGQPVCDISKGKSGDIHRKLKVGMILSGGNAAGGHNVVAGLFDALKEGNKDSCLIGFKGGAGGILDNNYIEITHELMDMYRNTGGFDIMGSGRTKIETPEQFNKAYEVITGLQLDAMVIVGGDDSNTNAALLAEYFKSKNSNVVFVGVPKTIDGDLKNQYIETSFGFDTATKTYSELVGNIQRDAISSRKYWHFVKIMGRSASHIALEVALMTHPTWAVVSEEVKAKKMTLVQVAEQIADMVENRSKNGYNFGVVIIPEGLLEFIPEMGVLISELNDLLAAHGAEYAKLTDFNQQRDFVVKHVSKAAGATFMTLPENIAKQLLLDRDPHGNVNVSAIETEKLVSDVVKAVLKKRGSKVPFSAVHHFFGYEGRCAFPSNFDATYCYNLGRTAMILAALKKTGQMAIVSNLKRPAEEWHAGGFPLTSMMNMEKRGGEMKPVIQKALVELDGKPFKFYAAHRDQWAKGDSTFAFPGAIQYYGSREICDQPTKTLLLEQS
jgi:pyrophosphate--fructose-6-phosphate 1-phosphotransferase